MSADSRNAFFHRDGEFFVGNDAARGPWSTDACHAGPVTAVIAGAIETVVPDKQLARITVSYVRPIPMAGFRVSAETAGAGRSAASARATLLDREGRLCAAAQSLHLATTTLDVEPGAEPDRPDIAAAIPGRFPVTETLHKLPFFGSEMEVAYPPGENDSPGPTTMWMRAPSIVEGQQPSPFQSVCPLADCGNGLSRHSEFTRVICPNPDLSIVLHRLPESDWLASRARSFWEPSGIGSTQATLYDTRGAIGSAVQTLLLRPL